MSNRTRRDAAVESPLTIHMAIRWRVAAVAVWLAVLAFMAWYLVVTFTAPGNLHGWRLALFMVTGVGGTTACFSVTMSLGYRMVIVTLSMFTALSLVWIAVMIFTPEAYGFIALVGVLWLIRWRIRRVIAGSSTAKRG